MRKKKYLAKIRAICLMLAMLFPTTAFAASAADSTTKLQTTVPKSHTVRLEIGEHGSVTVGKETYTGKQEIQVERLAEVSYKIKVEGKYEIETVTYDGKDVTDQLHGKSYQAPPINKDGVVFQVDFALKNSEKEYPPASGNDTSWNKDQEDGLSIKPGNTPQQGTTTNSNAVKTGDETPVMLLMVCALLSGGFLCVIVSRKKAASKK